MALSGHAVAGSPDPADLSRCSNFMVISMALRVSFCRLRNRRISSFMAIKCLRFCHGNEALQAIARGTDVYLFLVGLKQFLLPSVLSIAATYAVLRILYRGERVTAARLKLKLQRLPPPKRYLETAF